MLTTSLTGWLVLDQNKPSDLRLSVTLRARNPCNTLQDTGSVERGNTLLPLPKVGQSSFSLRCVCQLAVRVVLEDMDVIIR